MSGIMPNRPHVKTIHYTGEELRLRGLDFDISGGTDQPVIPGDPGIFLSSFTNYFGDNFERKGLKYLDRMLEVNGQSLENVTNMVSIITKKTDQ